MRLLSFTETAERLAVPVSTLRHWVHVGYGPPSIRIGKRRVFGESDVDQWISTQFTEQQNQEKE